MTIKNLSMYKIVAIFLFLVAPNLGDAQKWYKVQRSDMAVMACEVGAGYAQGWREQVIHHHYAMTQQFPGLFKNGNTFWDGRTSEKLFDADHILKGITAHLQIAAVCIRLSDLKSYKRKDRWKKIVFDVAKYYASYQLGFFLSWNVTHKNNLF